MVLQVLIHVYQVPIVQGTTHAWFCVKTGVDEDTGDRPAVMGFTYAHSEDALILFGCFPSVYWFVQSRRPLVQCTGLSHNWLLLLWCFITCMVKEIFSRDTDAMSSSATDEVMLPYYNPKNPWAAEDGGCSSLRWNHGRVQHGTSEGRCTWSSSMLHN